MNIQLSPWQKILRGMTDISLRPVRDSEVATFYWCSEINVSEIAEAYFDGRHANTFVSMVGPAAVVGKECDRCSGPILVFSRTEATSRASWGFSETCKKCREAEREQANASFSIEWKRREERAKELRYMPYAEYLRTPEWQATRDNAVRRARGSCQTCAGRGQLHVHHRTYARRGQEYASDLIVLCAGCHEIFHKNGKLADGGRAVA